MINDQRIIAQLEELLGKRPRSQENRAVRFKDLKSAISGMNISADADQVREIAERVARETASEFDGSSEDVAELRERIEAAFQEAEAARADVQNAISAANNAQQYADEQIAQARQEFELDYSQAVQAAQDALDSSEAAQLAEGAADTARQQAQQSAENALAASEASQLAQGATNTARDEAEASARAALEDADEARQERIASVNARSASEAARDAAVVAKDTAEGAEAAASESARLATEAESSAGASASAANESASLAGSKADEAGQSAVASETSRLAAETASGEATNARNQAVNARDSAVTAREDADGAAAVATEKAELAAGSASDAGNSADAAATSATAAASKADEASSEASAAESSRLRAEASRSMGPVLPADFTGGLADWTTRRELHPSTEPAHAQLELGTGSPSYGNFGLWTPHSAGMNVVTRGWVPTLGRAYRITADFIVESVEGSNDISLNLIYALLDAEGASSTYASSSAMSFEVGHRGELEFTISAFAGPGVNWVSPQLSDESVRYLRTGLRLNESRNCVIQIGSIKVEDVTQEVRSGVAQSAAELARDDAVVAKQDAEGAESAAKTSQELAASAAADAEGHRNAAKNSADASADSATLAGSKADEAGSSATASETSRLAAEAARDGATQARTGAQAARDTAVTSRQNAEEAASTATDKASLATQASQAAGQSADAAAESATTAASKATEAGQEASAAEASRLSAQAGRSMGPILPSTFDEGLTHWTTRREGSPLDDPWALHLVHRLDNPTFGSAGDWRPESIGHSVLTRGVVPAKDRAIEISVDFEVRWLPEDGDGDVSLAIVLSILDATYSSVAQRSTNGRSFERGVHNFTRVISASEGEGVTDLVPDLASDATKYLRAGFRLGEDMAPAPVIHIGSIRVSDVTQEVGAANSAASAEIARRDAVVAKQDAEKAESAAQTSEGIATSAAADAGTARDGAEGHRDAAKNQADAAARSASTAASKADEASSSASASETSRLAAEAARDDAQGFSGEAGVARDDAVSAKQDAEKAEAAAKSSLELTAEVSGRDMSIITDTFLQSSDWLRWTGQGSLTKRDNQAYPIGTSWDFNVAANQRDGLYTRSTSDMWTGTVNARGYVVELEFSHLGGSLTGASILLDWVTTTGSYRTERTLAQMHRGGGSSLIRQASAVFPRPAGFSGTFQSHNLYILMNWGSDQPAKRVQVHRVRIRPATDEELGEGEVLNGVAANLLVDYFTKAETDGAVADLKEELEAEMGGSFAAVKRSASAIANLDGQVARFKNITTVNGGQQAAGIEAVAFNQNGGASGSLLKLVGDNVVAEGTLSANALVVGLGKNLISDPSFADGTLHYNMFNAGGLNATFDVRAAGGNWAHPSHPTLFIKEDGRGSGFAQIATAPITDVNGGSGTIAVEAGAWYIASGHISCHRAQMRVVVQWYDSDGNARDVVGEDYRDSGTWGARAPDTWPRRRTKVQAPDYAVGARVLFRKLNTDAGESDSYMFVWKPQFEKVNQHALMPSEWDAGGVTYASGGRLVTNSVTARALNTESLSVAGLSIFGGTLASSNYDGNGNGWRITHGGQMDMPHASVDTLEVAGNAITTMVTGEYGYRDPSNAAGRLFSIAYSGGSNSDKLAVLFGATAETGNNVKIGLYHNGIFVTSVHLVYGGLGDVNMAVVNGKNGNNTFEVRRTQGDGKVAGNIAVLRLLR